MIPPILIILRDIEIGVIKTRSINLKANIHIIIFIMKLLIVSGFLGSGKTTFIIQATKAVSEKGFKPAIILNEVGETGIDDLFMRRLGLNVWELLGGCICCIIAGSLLKH